MIEWKSNASWKNPVWKYTPSYKTEVSKTIARVIREMKAIDKKNKSRRSK